jgi:hypothetical protein
MRSKSSKTDLIPGNGDTSLSMRGRRVPRFLLLLLLICVSVSARAFADDSYSGMGLICHMPPVLEYPGGKGAFQRELKAAGYHHLGGGRWWLSLPPEGLLRAQGEHFPIELRPPQKYDSGKLPGLFALTSCTHVSLGHNGATDWVLEEEGTKLFNISQKILQGWSARGCKAYFDPFSDNPDYATPARRPSVVIMNPNAYGWRDGYVRAGPMVATLDDVRPPRFWGFFGGGASGGNGAASSGGGDLEEPLDPRAAPKGKPGGASWRGQVTNGALGFAGGFAGEMAAQNGYGGVALGVGLGMSGVGGYAAGGIKGGAINLGSSALGLGAEKGAAALGYNETQAAAAGRMAGIATSFSGGLPGFYTYATQTASSDLGSIGYSWSVATSNGMSTSEFAYETVTNIPHYWGQMFGF